MGRKGTSLFEKVMNEPVTYKGGSFPVKFPTLPLHFSSVERKASKSEFEDDANSVKQTEKQQAVGDEFAKESCLYNEGRPAVPIVSSLEKLYRERELLLQRIQFVGKANHGLDSSRVDIISLRCSLEKIETELEELAEETEERETITKKTQDQLDLIFEYLSTQSAIPFGSVESEISPLTAEAAEWVSAQLKTERELEQIQMSLASALRTGLKTFEKSSDFVDDGNIKERAELIRKIDPLLQDLEGGLEEGLEPSVAILKRNHFSSVSGIDTLQVALSALLQIRRST